MHHIFAQAQQELVFLAYLIDYFVQWMFVLTGDNQERTKVECLCLWTCLNCPFTLINLIEEMNAGPYVQRTPDLNKNRIIMLGRSGAL